jgi:hypothetical protein
VLSVVKNLLYRVDQAVAASRFFVASPNIGLPEAAPCLVVGDVCLETRSGTGFWLDANLLRIVE